MPSEFSKGKYGTRFKENEDREMERVGTAKRYMEGSCEGGQGPPRTIAPEKEKKKKK